MTKDNLGQPIEVGDTVYYIHNLWRGKDELRKGVIKSLAGESALLAVGEESSRRCKFTKLAKV